MLEGTDDVIVATTAQITNSRTISSLGTYDYSGTYMGYSSGAILLAGSFSPNFTESVNLINNTVAGLIEGDGFGVGLLAGGTLNNDGDIIGINRI